MPNVDDIIQSVVNESTPGNGIPEINVNVNAAAPQSPVSLPEVKEENVRVAAATHQAALARQDYRNAAISRDTGSGTYSATGTERDLATLSYDAIRARYGAAFGNELISQLTGAHDQVQGRNILNRPTNFDVATDSVVGAGMAAVGGLGGLASLGLGLLDSSTGVAAARLTERANRYLGGFQSDALQGRQAINAERGRLDARDNNLLYDQEIEAGYSPFTAGLRNIARNARDAGSNIISDPMLAGDLASQAAGSLLSSGPIGRGVTAAGRAILPTAERQSLAYGAAFDRAAGNQTARTAMESLGRVFPNGTTVGIGLTEAGGAYQQSANNAAEMSFTALEANSPYYRELIAQNYTPEQAQSAVANRTGLLAGAITAPLAMGAGSLVSRFESAPLRVPTLGTAARNLRNETVEEAIQGGTGQFAQNIATQAVADSSQTLRENVGQQIALGALGGLGAAGVVQAPGAARASISAAGGAVLNAAANRANALFEQTEAQSPISGAVVRQQADALLAQAPAALEILRDGVVQSGGTPEAQAQANSSIDALVRSTAFDPAELATASEALRNVLAAPTDRLDAMQLLSEVIGATKEDGSLATEAAVTLYNMQQSVEQTLQSSVEDLQNLPESHPAYKTFGEYADLLNNINATPKVQRAMERAQKLIMAQAGKQTSQTINEQSLATPQGQRAAQVAVAAATLDPESANPEVVRALQFHAAQGRISLTSDQQNSLKMAQAILTAARRASALKEKLGHKKPLNRVSDEVLVSPDPNAERVSAKAYTNLIRTALRKGDTAKAQEHFKDLGRFVRHMQNKIVGLNQHFEQGGDKPTFQALNVVSRKFYESDNLPTIYPNSAGSVELAQTIELEGHRVAEIYNNLSKAFPELNGGQATLVPLNQLLKGATAKRVAEEFKSRKRVQPIAPAGSSKSSPPPAGEAPAAETNANSDSNTALVERDAVWANADNDIPVRVLAEAFMAAPDGRRYQKVSYEGRESYVPLDELKFAAKNGGNVSSSNKPSANKAISGAIKDKQQTPAAKATTLTEKVAPPQAEQPPTETMRSKPLASSDNDSEAETVTPTTLKEAFPQLVNGEFAKGYTNPFFDAFKLPKEAKSRTTLVQSPIDTLLEAFGSAEALGKFMGEPTGYQLDANIMQGMRTHLERTNPIIVELEKRLQAYLNKPLKASSNNPEGLTYLEQFRAGKPVWQYANGKLLSLTEKDPNSDGLIYNQNLLESGILAAVQWLLTADQNKGQISTASAAQIMGISANDVTDAAVDLMSQGLHSDSAKLGLTNKIREFWGLNTNNAEVKGYTDGLVEALAAELLTVLVETKQLQQTIVYLNSSHGLPKGQIRKPEFYSVVPDKTPTNPVTMGVPSLIERAVVVKPQDVTHFSPNTIEVPDTQLRQSMVSLTTQQQDMIKNANGVEYRPVGEMFDLYEALGSTGVKNLFGGGATEGIHLNVNHKRTLQGKNTTVGGAFAQIERLDAELSNRAKAEGGLPFEQQVVHYGHDVTRVGRLQMRGAYNVQSSKLVREAMASSMSEQDMTDENSDAYKTFMVGLAQALGIKVHQVSVDTAVSRVKALLTNDGPYAEAVFELQSWMKTGQGSDVLENVLQRAFNNTSKTGKKVKATELGVKALVEFARFQNTGANERANFATSLYIEADGVTNGVVNALMMLVGGPFTKHWVDMMAKGGLYLRGLGGVDAAGNVVEPTGPRTMNEQHTLGPVFGGDSADIYREGTRNFKSTWSALDDEIASLPTKAVGIQFQHMKLMLKQFLPDLNLTEDGIDPERGVVKNPMTVIVYGSSDRGIASTVTDSLMDALYERMSEAAERKRQNPEMSDAVAMFGPDATDKQSAEQLYRDFLRAYNSLSTTITGRTFEGDLYWGKPKDVGDQVKPIASIDFRNFTVEQGYLRNFTANVSTLYVQPLSEAISQTLGEPLMEALDTLKKGAAVQSVFQAHMFKDLVDRALEAKRATQPNVNYLGLSNNELEAIQKAVLKKFPLIKTGNQTFFPAGSTSVPIANLSYGTSLTNEFKSDGGVQGPVNAGVKGIPFLNQGMGDGLAIQALATMKDAPKDALYIFDGINFKVASAREDSVKANRAIHTSWQSNPLQALNNAYRASTPAFQAELARSDLSPELLEEVAKIFLSAKDAKSATPQMVQRLVTTLGRDLQFGAVSAEARHRVMAGLRHNIDQMATMGAPYEHQGVALQGANSQEIAAEMTALYNTELSKQMREYGFTPSNDDIARYDLKAAASAQPTGASATNAEAGIFSWAQVTEMGANFSAEFGQREIFEQIKRSKVVEGYTVVYGTLDQLLEHGRKYGKQVPTSEELASNGITNGYISVSDRIVYLVVPAGQAKPTDETLAHELIHAATLETLYAYYENKPLGANAEAIKASIEQLQQLISQFKALPVGDITDPSQSQAYGNAYRAIKGFENVGNKAGAMGEFLAWSLANRDLSKLLTKTDASFLVTLATKAIDALRQMFGLKTRPGKDMFSNVLFNTSVIVRAQPTLMERASRSMQFMATGYGTNERLQQVGQAFNDAVTTYLKSGPRTQKNVVDRDKDVQLAKHTVAKPIIDSVKTHWFLKTPQEFTTFEAIVAALATQARIDPSSMAMVQTLYDHVAKNLKVEMLMTDPQSQDPNVRAIAQEKLDVILGNYRVMVDGQGRSTLLPVFLGLAVVDDEFRAVLAKMPLPKTVLQDFNTLDSMLTNAANHAMDKLAINLAGTGKAANVQQAIDSLTQQIQSVVYKQESLMEALGSKGGGVLDKTNEFVTQTASMLGKKAVAATARLSARRPGTATTALAKSVSVAAAIANEDDADKVAQGVMAAMNNIKGWTPFTAFVGDLVGRTQGNQGVYDLSKKIRSLAQKTRQEYRENVPTQIAKRFTRDLEEQEWSMLYRGLAKTDLAVLIASFKQADVVDMLTDPGAVRQAILQLETTLQGKDAAYWPLVQQKIEQLSNHMSTGSYGSNLLRNADAVAQLLNEPTAVKRTYVPDQEYVDAVDQLATLYSLRDMPKADKTALKAMVETQREGVSFALSYLVGQRKDEMAKTSNDKARFNYTKGHAPSLMQEGASLVVADDADFPKLAQMSYVRVGKYEGSAAEGSVGTKSYYYAPVSARAVYDQGIMQNIRETAYGVETGTGFTAGLTAGRITEPNKVQAITARLRLEKGSTKENLVPVFNEQGEVVAYERAMDPVQLERLKPDTHLAKMVGVWRGRQVEERAATKFNMTLIDRLHDMYLEDMSADKSNQSQYVDLLDSASLDPVQRDAVSLMPKEARDYAKNLFKGRIYVRRDMFADAFGYRKATVGDAWTGNTRWSPGMQEGVKNIAMGLFGNDAYNYLVTAENEIQDFVKSAKQSIIVKSVVVPMANAVSNIVHLVSRGVPITDIVRAAPRKIVEMQAYTRGRILEIELEAQLRAATGNAVEERKLSARILSLKDSYKRLSIWPLIEAGEFSSISDAGISRDEILLSTGKLTQYLEKAANKLPGPAQTLGRYALVTKDTALFQGLQTAVEYGDFLAKAILYDDLTIRNKKSSDYALGRITEEFVNYDRLPGRARGYVEDMGLLWFYNFKIRSTKIALSMVRNNPVHALFAGFIPEPPGLGSIGTALDDNIASKFFSGNLGASIGPSMGLNAWTLNPWYNLTR